MAKSYFNRLLQKLVLKQAALAAACNVSRGTMADLVNKGDWPRKNTAEIRAHLVAQLTKAGASGRQIATAFKPREPIKEVGPAEQQLGEAHREVSAGAANAIAGTPSPVSETETEKENLQMLLEKQSLTPKAREHFNLPRDPFTDDVATPDDVFQTPRVRYVRAALTDCAMHHGFIGIFGESGAGKSTLAGDLEERLRASRGDVVIVRPYVLGMEENDNKGKTLKSGAIAEAIIHALAPEATLKSSPEARFRQAHELLRNSMRAGRRHLLLIEEAHCMPTSTLKHLKRWGELQDGMRRLIGIALIGQTELADRLRSGGKELREVAQRCELIELTPLDDDLQGYLDHKFKRFDLKAEQVLNAAAFDAIRARLVNIPRGGKPKDAYSVCYPLVVNNLVTRAMNAAAEVGYPVVDDQVIAGC